MTDPAAAPGPAPAAAPFTLGAHSLQQLAGVHPRLVDAVKRAIALTDQDFVVEEGLRSIEQERLNVAKGVSKTMNSMHLRQPDGWGHAVDLVPWAGGQPVWSWPLIFHVADAMRRGAAAAGVKLRWGGCWDRTLDQLGAGADAMKAAETAYCARHPGPDFVDGPHFELHA